MAVSVIEERPRSEERPGERRGATSPSFAAATFRAAEADSSCPLFTDPFAKPLLEAASAHGWQPDIQVGGTPLAVLEVYVACRTRWFDESFISAGAHGVDQAVILASGLDTRAWRLPWLSRAAVFEVDRPEVLDFKSATLTCCGSRPSVRRHTMVAADARTDWPEALFDSGFDRTEPAVWSLEGLLPDWSRDDRATTVRRAAELSSPCSRLAIEATEDEVDELGSWLAEHGWQVRTVSAQTLLRRYARCAPDDVEELMPRRAFVDATLPLTPTAGTPPSR